MDIKSFSGFHSYFFLIFYLCLFVLCFLLTEHLNSHFINLLRYALNNLLIIFNLFFIKSDLICMFKTLYHLISVTFINIDSLQTCLNNLKL